MNKPLIAAGGLTFFALIFMIVAGVRYSGAADQAARCELLWQRSTPVRKDYRELSNEMARTGAPSAAQSNRPVDVPAAFITIVNELGIPDGQMKIRAGSRGRGTSRHTIVFDNLRITSMGNILGQVAHRYPSVEVRSIRAQVLRNNPTRFNWTLEITAPAAE